MQDIATNIFSVARSLREYIARSPELSKFSISQIKALATTSSLKRATMKDIADALCVTSPSATVLVERLVKAGFLKRENDKNDRRVILLVITEKGKAILEKSLAVASKKMDELTKDLRESERTALALLLKKITMSIK